MASEINKKGSIILVLKVLEKYSDEEHFISLEKIREYIRYEFDVEIERKSISSSIKILNSLGYDINNSNKGFALYSRLFDLTQANYLLDAIFSSKVISSSNAKELIKTISSTLSLYDKVDYSYIRKSQEINRTSNNQIFYNISIIHQAMKEGMRVSFKMIGYDKDGKKVHRMNGYEYTVSPYYLVNNFGNYYLLCNYRTKYGVIQSFRVDHMVDVKVSTMPLKTMEERDPSYKNFSITKYLNEHIYLVGSQVIDAILEINNEDSIIYVKDWFGEHVKIYSENDKILCKVKCDDQALLFWVLQYSKVVKVVEPESLKEKVIKLLEETLKKYQE